ncbi:MAG: ParB/RepB/Spo0J family partition protein [Acidobacteria bacterium]|nr:ParB/RepB/Spo0J family partition protein [Acidobacteriota bacterium]MYH27391.1 ParB/RepB/Spo0J family partition protein [Acidobacteriota bacterium]MYK87616.1 ParB/RepB/Spo0J family partition protein [Acidobacteriota bacterium]
MAEKRKALGRGLRALIPDVPATEAQAGGSPREIDLDQLHPNPDQPRQTVDDARLEELAQSIRTHGVIQPIVVTQRDGVAGFEIIAGERRWRAAQRAGLLRVPVVLREMAPSKRLEVALIENIQREDLNPLEEAAAYQRLADEFGMTQQQIAEAVGKERATVANYRRLLGLPAEVQTDVAAGRLTMGHARALAGLSDVEQQLAAARRIREGELSVRDAEALVKRTATPKPDGAAETPPADVHVRAAEERLRISLGTRVRIVQRGKRGRIEISFTSENELQRLYDLLSDG